MASDDGHLLAALAGAQPWVQLEIVLPCADEHRERPATLVLRATEVTLRPPKGKRTYLQPRCITAVLAAEEHPPTGAQGARWLLRTTPPVVTRERRTDVFDRWLNLALQAPTLHRFAATMDPASDGP